MERILSPDERIKRAEEIYYKRKMQNDNYKSTRVNVSNRKDFRLLKKTFLQIAICIIIYSIYYMIQNSNYIFSEDVIKKTKEILSYDINIQNLYQQTIQYLSEFKDNFKYEPKDNLVPVEGENQLDSNDENIVEKNIDDNEKENIGGENISTENSAVEQNLSQMEKDAKAILESKSLVVPLKGTITSRFGLRNPETLTVPKNHTGIDIAVNEGTVFRASMTGVVEEVSSKRGSRKSFENC